MSHRIYLFCNLTYGQSYLKVLRAFALRFPNVECYVVLSSKEKSQGVLRKMARIATSVVRNALARGEINALAGTGIRLLESADVNSADFVSKIPEDSIGFIAGFNQILGKSIIDKFSLLLNFHPSILPYYRGAIPSYWTIRNGETTTGFTAHMVTEIVDAGEPVYQELVEINPGISEPDLDDKIAAIGSCFFAECLESATLGKPLRRRYVSAPYANKVDYVAATRW